MEITEIEKGMTGQIAKASATRSESLLPSPKVQNHAAFLSLDDAGTLSCVWFGGTLEGKSDISIYRSTLPQDATRWTPPEQLSDDPERSEQNPVLFNTPDGRHLLFHTAQTGGNQDECLLRVRALNDLAHPAVIALPLGSFVRAPVVVRDDGGWLLPLFRCKSQAGRRWTGRHDTSVLAISTDAGATWRTVDVPNSTGSVHMTIVPLDGARMVAFFRRRQADFVFRSESLDGGESWSAPAATDVPNNNSSIAAIRLIDGRIALLCNPVSAATSAERRVSLYDELGDDPREDAEGGCTPVWGVPRAPLTLCISTDDGVSFARRHCIEDGPGTCLSNNSLDGKNHELSYPSMLQAPDGTLHMAFTYHRRAIKYVRLDSGWTGA